MAEFTPKQSRNFSLSLLLPSNSPELQASPGRPPSTQEATGPRGERWAFRDVRGDGFESAGPWEAACLPEEDTQFVHVTVL